MRLKVYIETYGCQMNVADSDTVMSILKSSEFDATQSIDNADIILINTCSVRDNAEQKIWRRLDYIKGMKRRNKKLKVGIIGCMAQRISDKLLENEAVNFVAGPDSYRHLAELINETDLNPKQANTVFDVNETYSGIENTNLLGNEISGYVSITRGCNNFCTYCIVPYVRGKERSRSEIDILREVEKMGKSGYKEITLLGQNVNSYSFNNINFPQLIDTVAQTFPTLRLRFTTSHPKDISNDLIETIAIRANICNHIHLPVQSGSNRILELMNRKYTRENYLERIEKIKTIIPNCGLSTDVFCGFSTETDEDFFQTLDLLKTVRFDSAFMFKYSVREGTYAAKTFKDDVREEEKIARLNMMIDLQNNISKKNNETKIGEVFDVLVEDFSKRSVEQMYGRTQTNNVVVFSAKNINKGDFVRAKIKQATSATLIGELV
jgi:tRNA-2-methylthio-N6-dimethylallyladenosine synthase